MRHISKSKEITEYISNLFIHVPKCAGTSIRNIEGVNTIGRLHVPHFKFSDESIENVGTVFTVVRNPYDRFVSAFYYLTQISSFKDTVVVDDINEFCKLYHQAHKNKQGKSSWFGRTQIEIQSIRKHYDRDIFKPQLHYIRPICRLDYILSVEKLEEEWPELSMTIFNEVKKLPHKKISKHKSWEEELNEESIQVINDIYEDDFKVLTYEMK